MKKTKKLFNYYSILKFNWRISWYAVFVWLLSFVISGVVILPWFYVVFPLAILLVSYLYFGKQNDSKKRSSMFRRAVFAQGLSTGFFWFLAILVFDFIQFVGLDLSGAGVYFLDSRNFIKYPIVILIPTILALILKNRNIFRGRMHSKSWFSPA